VTLDVEPLPRPRPKEFKGPAVGRVRASATLEKQRLRADEGVQLSIVTRVEGLIQNVPEFELPEIPGLRVFPPNSDTQTQLKGHKVEGVRRQRWLLRPKQKGKLKIPSLKLSYFDPSSGSYRKAQTRALRLEVLGTPGIGAAPLPTPKALEASRLELRSVHDQLSESATALSPLLYLLLILPPLLLLALLIWEQVQLRRSASAGGRAAKRAARDAQRALDALPRKRAAEVYSSLSKILMTYLSARSQQNLGGVTQEQLKSRLRTLKVSDETLAELLKELENCDYARFAPSKDLERDIEQAIHRTAKVIHKLEEALG